MLWLSSRRMDKLAIVTGANRGIGLEISKQLLDNNFKVVLTARDERKGKQVVEKIGSENLFFHQLDVTNISSIRTLHSYIKKKFDKLDVLINNAGVYVDGGHSFFDLPDDRMKMTMEINLMGPWRVTSQFIDLLRKSKDARVIHISSRAGQSTSLSSSTPSYRVSKAGLNAMTQVMASELSSSKITVNSVCPGWVRTEMGGSAAPRSIEEGADTAVWLATRKEKQSGKFFAERTEIPW